jgi:hypothetical protein
LAGSDALVTEHFVLEKIDYFSDIQLWPRTVQPKRWLDNFLDCERPYAVHLLNSFAHFNQDIVNQLFVSAFQLLSCEVLPVEAPLDEAVQAWTEFHNRVLITPVNGENPSPADSGYRYATKARDLLGIHPSQLATHEEALKAVVSDATRPIIFVDDFVGSGQQILRHWERQVTVNGTPLSFSFVAIGGMAHAYYCCALATDYGVGRIATAGLPLTVRAGNILPANASAVASDSLVWPKSEYANGVAFLNAANARAGITANTTGFHDLGLTVGIEGRVPDATLPIFLWDQNDWIPLFGKLT